MHAHDHPEPCPRPGPLDDYKDIFNQRGQAYHQAMSEFPAARDEEFREILRLADPRPGQTLCDAPSGGGYLPRYLPCQDYELIALETSDAFHRLCQANGGCRALRTELHRIDLPDASVDGVISLAGLHHLHDRAAFFGEACRILVKGGSCCVADVAAGSRVDRFLNVFVDRWNSMGHRGDFFGPGATQELEAVGFRVVAHYTRRYPWRFRNPGEMVRYVSLLFGLDRAGPGDVLRGIDEFLGYRRVGDECLMDWELLFMKGVKPD